MKINARRLVTGRGWMVTALAAGVLVGGGAATAVAASHGGSAAPARSAAPAQGPPAGTATAVTAAQAADAALKAAPGKVEEVELDGEHGKPVWEIDVLADGGGRRDVTVDPGTGKVLSNRADRPDADDHDHDHDDGDGDGDGDGRDAAALREAAVSASQAADAALKSVPGRVTSVEFEQEHGRAFWEVDVTGRDGVERELHVDAASAKILATEAGDD